MPDEFGPQLLFNGRIYRSAHAQRTESWLLIEGARVRDLGPDGEPTLSGLKRVDLGGRTVLPGLVDAHIHLEHYAQHLGMIDCELPRKADCLKAVADHAGQNPGQGWVLGHGWNQNTWGEYGSAAELDQILAGRPIFLSAKSLHAAWVNSAALRLAGINAETLDPPGGQIQRGAGGEPTGVLFESALELVRGLIPTPEPAELADLISPALDRLLSVGLTGVHDFDGPSCLAALQVLRERGELGLRVVKNVPADSLDDYVAAGLRSGFGDDWIRLGNVKAFADGALGPRTAAMLSPYLDEPMNQGILLLDGEAVSELGMRAAAAGFGLSVHAIGDRANHEVLNGLDNLREFELSQGLPARRHRIEHLQLLHPDDLARPAQLGLVASMQPIHATSDRKVADRAWGERSKTAYAWRSQLRLGARLAFGSDAPVEDPNPFLGLHAALTRRDRDGNPGPDGWIPGERLDLIEALGAYTEGPAYASGAESRLGRIEPGYLADLIVLDRDPRELEPERIAELRPAGVVVGGQWKKRNF